MSCFGEEVTIRTFLWAATAFSMLFAGSAGSKAYAQKVPIILDTDIGTDIDDAFTKLSVVWRTSGWRWMRKALHERRMGNRTPGSPLLSALTTF